MQCSKLTKNWLRRWLAALLLCTTLASQTLGTALAAPAAGPAIAQMADTAPYDDPDGLFSLNLPDRLTESQIVTYADVSESSLDGLVNSTSRIFGDRRGANSIIILFLLLDQEITDADGLTDFVARFQESTGGEVLPDVEFEISSENGLYAVGSAENKVRHLTISLEAQGDLVTVIAASLEQRALLRYQDDITEALNSFTWSADAVGSVLASVPPSQEATPEPTEEPAAEPTPAAGTEVAPATMPELERYADSEGVFTLKVPVGLEGKLQDPKPGGYGFGFYDPNDTSDISLPPLAVSLVAAGNVLDPAASELLARPINDDEWTTLIDQLVAAMGNMEVLQEIRNPAARTAYVVVDTGPLDEAGASLRIWMWIEEADGILAFLSATGAVDPNVASPTEKIFHAALASFAWSPTKALSSITQVVGATPAAEPVPFNDPLVLAQMNQPRAFPFQSAYVDAGGIHYRFGATPDQGVITLNLSPVADQSYSAEEWQQLVQITEGTIVAALEDNGLGEQAELLSSDIGVPAVDSGNTALLTAQSSTYQAAVLLVEQEGVLATAFFLLPNEAWQASEGELQVVLDQAPGFDPDGIRNTVTAYNDLGITLQGTTMTTGRPQEGQDIQPHFAFGRSESVTVLVGLAENQLEGNIRVVLQQAQRMPDQPAAIFDVALARDTTLCPQSSSAAVDDSTVCETDDIIIRQDADGTRVATIYQADNPLPADTFTAKVYYQYSLIAVHQFTVSGGDEPVETKLASFGVYVGDTADNGALTATSVVAGGDSVVLRGTGDLPPGQLRLFWADENNIMIADAVQTIRLPDSSISFHDWFYFTLPFAFPLGTYHYLLTLEGEELSSSVLTVLEDTPEVELDEDGINFFAALPLPAGLEIAPVVEGIDLALVPSMEFTSDDLLSTLGAWLRQEGWQQTWPVYRSPLDYHYQRWVKDAYQVVIQPGGGDAADQIWLQYLALDDENTTPPPALDLALTPETALDAQELGLVGIAFETAVEAALSPDGHWLALVTAEGKLALFDAQTLHLEQWWSPQGAVYRHPLFHPESKRLAVTVEGENRFQLQIFDNFDLVWLPTTTLAGHMGAVTGLAYAANGLYLLSAGRDAAVRVWSSSGTLPSMVSLDTPATGLALSPSDDLLMTALDGGQVELWDLNDNPLYGAEPLYSFATQAQAPQLVVSPLLNEQGEGELLAFGDGVAEWWGYNNAEAHLFSAIPVDVDDFTANGGVISPNGTLTVVAGPYATIYESTSGNYLADWTVVDENGDALEISWIGVSPDGRFLMAATVDGNISLLGLAAQ